MAWFDRHPEQLTILILAQVLHASEPGILVDAIDQEEARELSTFLEIDDLFMLLSSVSSREMKSTGVIGSKCAKPGMPIPSLYSDLSIRMNGQVGSTNHLDYHNMIYYYWIIIVWINGPYICIVIIYYLLVNEVGFAHPKIIDSEELKTLKLNDASKKFIIIDRKGVIADPKQTCYRGYIRFILKLIQDLLASENCLINTDKKPIDVLILLIDDFIKGLSRHNTVETDYQDAVKYLRRLQMAISLGGVEDAKTYLVTWIDKVLGYQVKSLSLDTYPYEDVSIESLLHSAIKAFKTKVNELFAYSERDVKDDESPTNYLPDAIRRLLSEHLGYVVFENQLNCITDETSITGCYVNDISYTIVTDFDNCHAKYSAIIKSSPPPPDKGQSAIAVFMNSGNDTSFFGYIFYQVVGETSEVDGTKITDKEISRVCKLDDSICITCTLEMGTVFFKDKCCHVDLSESSVLRSKCVCVSEVLKDEIRNYNAKHGVADLITVNDKHDSRKRNIDQVDSTSSSTAIADTKYCYCGSDYVQGTSMTPLFNDTDSRGMLECSGSGCKYNGWIHFACSNLDPEKYQKVDQWFCVSCSRLAEEAEAKRKSAKTSKTEDSVTISETKSSDSDKGPVKMEEG